MHIQYSLSGGLIIFPLRLSLLIYGLRGQAYRNVSLSTQRDLKLANVMSYLCYYFICAEGLTVSSDSY